jgi:hypothetical protein
LGDEEIDMRTIENEHFRIFSLVLKLKSRSFVSFDSHGRHSNREILFEQDVSKNIQISTFTFPTFDTSSTHSEKEKCGIAETS